MEMGAQSARSRALAVLRIRSRALAVALLPAAVAVVLLAGGATGHFGGGGWEAARWAVTVCAVVVLLVAAAVAAVIVRARPAVSPTVEVAEESAPDLYRLVRDLADRLEVPAPSAIALTPDCDSWLEDRTHPAAAASASTSASASASASTPIPDAGRRRVAAPVLVIGSPFLWWMRVAELRAVLAPVVAGTGPSAHPDIAAARRFVRGLDAAVAVASRPGLGPVRRIPLRFLGWVARLLLRSCRVHAAEMERGVATTASERAQAVDYGLRIVAQEQVGLAYAGWDRLMTRVALPAWRMGRWPSRLDVGVVSALTELSRRDRLAEGFTSRLGERPACDLLEEPGAVDEAVSLLAARLFHGGPAEPGPDWSPVDWQQYPEEVVDRKWRADAARLHRVLDKMGVRRSPGSTDRVGPTLARVMDHLSAHDGATGETGHAADGTRSPDGTDRTGDTGSTDATAGTAELGQDATGDDHTGDPGRTGKAERTAAPGGDPGRASAGTDDPADTSASGQESATAGTGGPARTGATDATGDDHTGDPGRTSDAGPTGDPGRAGAGTDDLARTSASGQESATAGTGDPARTGATDVTGDDHTGDPRHTGAPAHPNKPHPGHPADPRHAGDALAAGISAEVAREEAAAPAPVPHGLGDDDLWDTGPLPLFPLQPPRTGRELLADHVTAMVCCAAVDTAGAAPGLDWLDGPALLIDGERRADLGGRVLSLVEDGDAEPLRSWLASVGVRPEKPVRLV
ncbi:hypothetical protein J7I98_15995 [Streptomyces sp. ISL-98]|uniref:hypothetical protein n=1 Tax=Streptomyces sp. ISL-98 TaxID=2819192 RepID=UPI001BE6F247|nr:hypothetical protein [Streptomyces sp. ISL-98]